MKEISIFGANRIDPVLHSRIGCRGIVLREGKILLSRETKSGWWLIPGGGLEGNESLEDCCIREVEEETGYIVHPIREFLTLNEFYEDYRYISHYFICSPAGIGHIRLTEAELKRGLEPAWLPLEEALELFSHHQDFASTSEEKRGSYQREYTALCEYVKSAVDL